jgi:hypothetical protein
MAIFMGEWLASVPAVSCCVFVDVDIPLFAATVGATAGDTAERIKIWWVNDIHKIPQKRESVTLSL